MSNEKKQLSLITPIARASFPVLVTPKASVAGGEPKYSLTLLFDRAVRQTPEYKALERAVEAAISAKWPGERPRKLKLPFLTIDDLDNVPDGYTEEHTFIRTTSKQKPAVVSRDPTVRVDGSDVYAGMYVRASVRVYAWEHKTGGKGVSFGLSNIQIVMDGEPFGGGRRPEDEFSSLETDDDPYN